MRRIIDHVLRVIERVNVEVDFDPVVPVVDLAHADGHALARDPLLPKWTDALLTYSGASRSKTISNTETNGLRASRLRLPFTDHSPFTAGSRIANRSGG